jgi:hypothetical protein
MDTKQVLLPKLRTDLSKTIVVANSPVSKYKVVVFVRHLKGKELPNTFLPFFKAKIQLFSHDSVSTTKVELPGHRKYTKAIEFITPEELDCLSKSD